MTRHFWVLTHRYAGLYMAFFLTIAGLTGSILAFDGEIRDWLDPPSRVAVGAQPMLDPVALRERALALAPLGQITSPVSFRREPGEAYTVSFEPRTDPATGKPLRASLQHPHARPLYRGRDRAQPAARRPLADHTT